MSATLAITRRSYCFATLLCCPSPFYSIQHRRHVLPHVLSARAYSSNIVVSRQKYFRIQTLHPSRIRPSDFMDISLKMKMGVYGPDSGRVFGGTYTSVHRFPEGTRGFLYYNSPEAGVPPAAGELRFRVIPENAPASFVRGSDLLLETGLPWSVPLLAMVERSYVVRKGWHYQPIRQLLLDDGFITPALLETYAAMLKKNIYSPERGSRIIHSFGQLFHITFDARYITFFTLSKDQLQYHKFQNIFYGKFNFRPYSGSALCCFERSDLPQHKGTRTAVIRIVKIISPVTYRDPNYNGPIPLPIEGELVQCYFRGRGPQPRSYNVDSKLYMGLQTLFRDGN